ncbi:hypothetical protein T12_15234 [Trichinella patagoniensis]|uniref:Uncharacterized protein n=1 Tax=Trichinella patagoniensis TaxID=990121 RepID=A0A0V0YSL1_9BILA|nr:hypothetical protein T12_15234 [Trichinella patagoniensis]
MYLKVSNNNTIKRPISFHSPYKAELQLTTCQTDSIAMN